MRTTIETNEMIERLRALRPLIIPESLFGDDNIGALNAQIEVLENKMSPEDVDEKWDDGETQQQTLDSARDAATWLEGEEPEFFGQEDAWPLKH